MNKSTRNGEIELWRGVFCMVVFLYHLSLDSDSSRTLFPLGQIGVEFFFLVSGLFMAAAASKRQTEDCRELGRESFQYVLYKYSSMFPYHGFAFCTVFLGSLLKDKPTLMEALEKCLLAVPQFLLIHMSGMVETPVLSIEWYISSMLLAMLLIYPLLRRFYNMYVYVVGPLSACLIFGYMYSNNGNLLQKYQWGGIATMAIWRAIAIMNLGCLAYELGSWIKNRDWARSQRLWLTLAQLAGYLITLLFAQSNMGELVRFTLVFLLLVSVAISFSGIDLYGKYLDNGICRFIGKISLPFYLNTNLIRMSFRYVHLNQLPYRFFILIGVLVNFVLSSALVLLVERIRVRKRG